MAKLEAVRQRLLRTVQAHRNVIDLPFLGASLEGLLGEQVDAQGRVIEFRVPGPARKRQMDRVRDLRGQFVGGERRNETDDSFGNAFGNRRQVRLGADRSAAVGTFDAAQDAGREWVQWNRTRDNGGK